MPSFFQALIVSFAFKLVCVAEGGLAALVDRRTVVSEAVASTPEAAKSIGKKYILSFGIAASLLKLKV